MVKLNLPDWPFALQVIWACGAALVLGYALRQHARVSTLTSQASALTGPGWSAALRQAKARLSQTRPVKLLVSDQVGVPMTWGWRNPVIILPCEAQDWTRERRQVVLLHELAHIVRHDWLTQWLALISCAVNWFNPLVWHAARQAHVERERACDDMVLCAGVAGSDYAGHLLDIARGVHSGRRLSGGMFLSMARQSDLARRINSILNQHHSGIFTASRRLLLTLIAVMLALPLSAIQLSRTGAQNTTVLSIAIRSSLAGILTPDLLKQFEDAHPGVKLNVVPNAPCCSDPSAGLTPMLDNLQRYASSADVLYVDNNRMSVEATRAGYFLDLAPLVAVDKTLNPDDFYPVAQRAYQWDQGVWALPVSLEPMILSYNPDAFDKLGLAHPDGQWTLDDLAGAARKLAVKRADGTASQVGMSAPQAQFLFRSLLNTGFSDDSAIPNMPHFATPEVAAVLDAWVKLDAEGVVTSNFIDRPVMGVEPIEDVLFQPKNPDYRRGGALLPGGKSFVDTLGFAVSAGTASPELAYELASWLTMRGEVADYLSLLPARKSLRDASLVRSGGKGGKGGGLSAEAIQLLDDAVTNGFSYSDLRFAPYVMAAYNRAKTNHIPAIDALQRAESDALKAQQDSAAKKPSVKASLAVATPASQAPLAPGKIALKFVVSTPHVAGKPPNQAQWDKVIQDFTASDPQVGQITLDWSPDDNLSKFASSYDCFFIPANQVPAAPLNSLISLDPFMAADKTFDKSDFLGNTVTAVQRDGKTYAFPLGIEPMILQVNADQLTRIGLSIPADGWTIGSFIDALHKLKQDASDPAPLDTSRGDGTHLLALITAFGGLPLDYRTTPPTINFTDPANVTAIQQVLDLARQGYLQYSRVGVLPPAQRGPAPVTAPMFSDTVNNLSAVASMKMGMTDKYQPMLYPKGSQFNGVAYTVEAAYISAQTTYPEACYRWISALSQHPELFPAMPARHSQVNASALKGTINPAVLALYTRIDALFGDAHTVSFPIPDQQNTSVSDYLIRYWLYKAFDSYVLDGKDLTSSLKDAENNAKAYQTCAANLPDKVVGNNSASAFQPYIDCAERADPGLKPTFDQLLAGG